MNKEIAIDILKDRIRPNGALCSYDHYMNWYPGEGTITLDDSFTDDELEAIVWWMRNIKPDGYKK